ncbi:HepT-like ribonuclease domain-containing protein [Larkinella ripae]
MMLECIEKIILYSRSFTNVEEFVWANDQQNYNASWGLFLVIGEEAKQLDSGLKSAHQQIPWRNIAGMRNFLAHNYRGIDYDLVYEVINNYLPSLKDVLIKMVDQIEYEKELLKTALDSPYYRHIQYLRSKLDD